MTEKQIWPYFEDDEIAAVVDVLRSGRVNYWTGEQVQAFEGDYAEACGTRFAIALANGTVALELALRSLGIGPGDEVVVTPRSFVASASCAVLCGAKPVFADVDPDSQNITAMTIAPALTPRTRAIVCVHLAGWPCDMDPILELARGRGIAVIEDCAQAHGARYKDRPVGALGDVGVFSFCQDKIITTGGEGGMLVTSDPDLWERAWSFKDHGKSRRSLSQPPVGGFRWLHDSLGTNWRMTEMQAAIGRVQLRKLPRWSEIRRRNAQLLDDMLEDLPALRLPRPKPDVEHAYYKYYAFVRPERLRAGWSRDRILAELNARSVRCLAGACPEIYRERLFDSRGLAPAQRLPAARALGETSLMLLVDPTFGPAEMATVAQAIQEVMAAASAETAETARGVNWTPAAAWAARDGAAPGSERRSLGRAS